MIANFYERLQKVFISKQKRNLRPIEIRSIFCKRSFYYSSDIRLKDLDDYAINEYLVSTKENPLSEIELNKHLVFLIEKNRRTTDEKIKNIPAYIELELNDSKKIVLDSIKPFISIFTLFGAKPAVLEMTEEQITTNINPEILSHICRLLCFVVCCLIRPGSSIIIGVSYLNNQLGLSVSFNLSPGNQVVVLEFANDRRERERLDDFLYDAAYLLIAYTNLYNGKMVTEVTTDETMTLSIHLPYNAH